jgi:hypothetical protein
MRILIFSMALITALALPLGAQQHPQQHPKKSPYSTEKKTARPINVQPPKASSSSSQELRRIEQESAHQKGGAQRTQAHATPVMKTEREKPNPPIHFSAASDGHTGLNNQGNNPYKGRLRQKGNGKH